MSKKQQKKQQKNGKSSDAEKNREWKSHLNNWQNGQADDFESAKARYLEKLTKTGMTDAGISMLDNMVDRSFVLGNLTDAEVHEIKWRMHTMYLKIQAQFPPRRSDIQGPKRAFLYNDPDENLYALSDQQRHIIAQMIIGIHVYVSRSRDGFQQEMMIKSINVSEVMDPDEEGDQSALGFFS